MREYLFRGKHICNGEWYEGSLLVWPNGSCMIKQFGEFPFENKNAEVQPKTVGQYTGLTDKSGKRIFEGDIIKDDWGKIFKVIFTTTSCGFMVECTVAPNEYEKGKYRLGDAWCNTISVVGNIHDNPELLNK